MDAQCCKLWSKRHGHDTYGSSDNSDTDKDEIKPKKQKKRTTGGQCRCGSTAHQRTNHSDCPLNVNNQRSNVSVDERASENDVIYYFEDSPSDTKVLL